MLRTYLRINRVGLVGAARLSHLYGLEAFCKNAFDTLSRHKSAYVGERHLELGSEYFGDEGIARQTFHSHRTAIL